MKKLIAVCSLAMMTIALGGQILDPVRWEFSYERVGADEYNIVLKAIVDDNWYIYSSELDDGGPIPTSVSFTDTDHFEVLGELTEKGEPIDYYDEGFEMDVVYYAGTAHFIQRIRGLSDSFTVSGTVEYMACDDSQCTPPQYRDFEIGIGATEYPDAERESRRGLTGFFFLSMLFGFAGILTPCVFPMIPMTIAFFSRSTKSRREALTNALVFGLSILTIYTLPGIIVSLTSAGAGFAQTLSTHWIPNLIFFILFVTFATSFFGAFDIVLPNRWISSADSKVDKGGVAAAFFLGLTTVLVSFSCTGPLVGALIVEAATGDVLRPTIGMLGFGTAFALPFTLLAIFPSALKKMPASGGWLNSVKVVLGFIILAFSLKFISIIDSVYHLNLISRDLFISVWIVLALLNGLYLMGKIRFSHDSDIKSVGVFRLLLIIASFTFAIYLVPGLFGAPLKGLSGLLPPPEKSGFNIGNIIRSHSGQYGPGGDIDPVAEGLSDNCYEPRFGDILTLPHGLNGYFELEQGLQCAREQGKPLLLDFTGHACSNCREMEARVWSDPDVLRRLRENFVIVALYVDDRTRLPEEEWVVSQFDGRVKRTIGQINQDISITRFGTNAIPLYVIVDHDGNPLNEPRQHDLDVRAFIDWLDDGLERFSR